MLLIFSPLHIYLNLSISRELFWNLTPVVRCKSRHCHTHTYNEKQDIQAQQLVLTTDIMTSPRSCLPQNNYFLITYQTGHHYHGNDKANNNYYSY